MAGVSLDLSAAWMPPWAIMVLASPRRSLVTMSTLAPRRGYQGRGNAGPAAADDQDVHVLVHPAEVEGIRVDAPARLQQIGDLVRNPVAVIRAQGELPHRTLLVIRVELLQQLLLRLGREARHLLLHAEASLASSRLIDSSMWGS